MGHYVFVTECCRLLAGGMGHYVFVTECCRLLAGVWVITYLSQNAVAY